MIFKVLLIPAKLKILLISTEIKSVNEGTFKLKVLLIPKLKLKILLISKTEIKGIINTETEIKGIINTTEIKDITNIEIEIKSVNEGTVLWIYDNIFTI